MYRNKYEDDDDYDYNIEEEGLRESYSSMSRRSPQPPQRRSPHPPPGLKKPQRPSTTSTPKMRIVRGKFKQQHIKDTNDHIIEDNNINHILDGYERMPREALIASLMDTKKKLISTETLVSSLKAENQRWENEISKQQKRIDKLLDTSTNRHGTSAADIRKELEKSTIVRQLKRQNHSMKNNLIDKDIELEKIKKSIKGSALMILSTEKDEYYMECLRLKELVSKLIEENKIYKYKLKQHGKEDDEIRREVVRLSSGFQSLLESAAVSSSAVDIQSNHHKKGSKNKDKDKQILNYFNSDIVTKDSGIQFALRANDVDNVDNVPILSTPTVINKHDKPKDIFDITPSTPFPLLNHHGNGTNTPVAMNSSTASSTSPPNTKSKSSPPKSPVYEYKYKVGARVQGQYKGGINWYDATIKSASNKGGENYHLIYDDGDEEKTISVSHVRLLQDEHQQSHQQKTSPSKQLFEKYLDGISDDDDDNKNNISTGPKQRNDNDYDDDFEA